MDWAGLIGGAAATVMGAGAIALPEYRARRAFRQRWASKTPTEVVSLALVRAGLNQDQAVNVMRRYRDGG